MLEINNYKVAFNATRSTIKTLLEINERLIKDFPDNYDLPVKIAMQKDFIRTMDQIEANVKENM